MSFNSMQNSQSLNEESSKQNSSFKNQSSPNFSSSSLLSNSSESFNLLDNQQIVQNANNSNISKRNIEEGCGGGNNLQIQKKQKKIKKVKYIFKLYQAVEVNDCFLIEGEFLFYPKAFMSYMNHNHLEQSSPMNQFRAVRKVNFFDDQRIDMELDNTIDTYGNVEIVKQYLNKMIDNNSKQLSTFVHYYEYLIRDQQSTLNQVKEYYLNKEQELIDKLDNNFQQSLQIANKYLEQLNKQETITLYFIRRVNPKNLFKKSHSMGGTKTLLDVIFGPNAIDKQAMMEKLLREGVPNLLDYRGFVQYVLQSFSGVETETIDLITVDMFKIPCRIKSMNLPLSSVEIIPGCVVFDELVYTTYIPTNLKIVENLQKIRKDSQKQFQSSYQMDISDFTYEAKSEQFIEKYYPDVSYQLKFKRKKPENFKKSQQQQQNQNEYNNELKDVFLYNQQQPQLN